MLFLRLINRFHPSSFHPAFSVIRFLLITCCCVYAGYLAVLFLRQPRYLTPDQLFIVLLLFVLGIQKGRRIRLFLVDWLPFILFIILYNMMRSLAPRLYSRVHVSEPYQGELTVFGWMANGDIPAFALQSWRADHAGEFLMIAAEVVLGAAYASFFIAPIVLMAILWWKLKDRRLFWRFSCLLNLHNFMALATFVLYPAAPPWYFQRYGAIQPTDTAYGQVAAGGLVHLDEMLNMGLFTTVLGEFQSKLFCGVAVAPRSLARGGRDVHPAGVRQEGLAHNFLSGVGDNWGGILQSPLSHRLFGQLGLSARRIHRDRTRRHALVGPGHGLQSATGERYPQRRALLKPKAKNSG